MGRSDRAAVVAWLLAAAYYFYQYALRSTPAVMLPQLSGAFNLDALGLASMLGLFYYGYSVCCVVAGPAVDRLGPRKVLPLGAAAVGVGALLFASANPEAASAGRLLQGAGGAFALVGTVYIASRNFAASRAATLIGAAQMFGMAGGSAGQLAVGPMVAAGLAWNVLWGGLGAAGLLISILLLVFLPKSTAVRAAGGWLKGMAGALGKVLKNPQSILCGVISGLLFLPTTVFDMVWGVRFLQEAHGFDYSSAVLRSATVPLGWVIGCPLLGFLSDRVGRRKPVIIGGSLALLACLAWILYGQVGVFPPYGVGAVAGLASGAAMLPYTVCKEANPPGLSGTTTGVVSFLNLSVTAWLGPVYAWILQRVSGGADQMTREHYQMGFEPLLYGVAIAIILTLFLKETGAAAGCSIPSQEPSA